MLTIHRLRTYCFILFTIISMISSLSAFPSLVTTARPQMDRPSRRCVPNVIAAEGAREAIHVDKHEDISSLWVQWT